MKSDELKNDLIFFGQVVAEPEFEMALNSQRLAVTYRGTRQGNAVLIVTRPSPLGGEGRGDWDLWVHGMTDHYLNVHFEVRSRTELRLDYGFGSRMSASKVYGDLANRNELSLLRLKEKTYEEIEHSLSAPKYQGRLRPVPVESRPKGAFDRAGNQSVLRYPYSGFGDDAGIKQIAEFFAEVICGTTADLDTVIVGLKRDPLVIS